MKTRNLSLGIVALLTLFSFNAHAQKNLIRKSIADLPVGKVVAVESDKSSPEEKDIWLYRLTNELELGTVKVEQDKSLKRNVIHCDFYNQKSWYGTYITYRTKDQHAQRAIYRLSFKTKGTPDKNMKCIILGNNGSECMIAARKSDTEVPAGYKQFSLTDKYTQVQLDFDFSKTVKAPYPYPDGNGNLRDSSDEVLNNFFILFSPNSNETEFYLDDVTLELKKD